MTQIILKNIGKKYGKNWILQDINVTFSSGQVYGLIGENGAGKTVLLRLICGLSIPTNGEVQCNGKVLHADMEFLDSCGVIIETPGFLASRTGLENLRYLEELVPHGSLDRAKIAMQICGLDPLDRKKVSAYSLGMRQRLGIAQAIMDDPDILILDEATNGLDKQGTRDVCKIISEAKAHGKLIILASHHMEEIEEMCDTVYKIQGKKLVECTP